ncbi:TIGR02147 family protein [Bdellovibrio sp.]|uniref:TIGR02147 family protein n=1 Tax=Bdellovibrio TaxID=958 RepID=UPI00322160FA
MELSEANQHVLSLIKSHLANVQTRNPQFSLRSFAKKVGVSASTLSQALHGKRVMNKSTVKKVLTEIAPTDTKAWECLEAFKDFYPSSKTMPQEILSKRIPEDELMFFKKWYHLAMVTFFDSSHYDGSVQSISQYFGISFAEAQEAVDRLKRLGIVEEHKERLRNTAQFYFTDRSRLAESIHASKTQALKNAVQALESQTAKESSDFSMMFTVFDPSLVPEAIEYIDKMKKGFAKKFKGKGDKSAVYQLSIQLLPCGGTSPELSTLE